MATTGRSTVVGVFRNREQARDAIDALKDSGFAAQDIGILMQDKGDTAEMAQDTGTKAGTGAATGAIGGGILGGLAGWLVGIGALAIPGVGPFIAAGALGTAIAGAAVGAGLGAIAGALVGMGVPEEEAKWYEGEVRGGGTLVTVRADTRYDDARRILRDHGAYDIQDRDAGTVSRMGTSTGTSYDTSTTGSTMGTTGRWEDESPRYRSMWQRRYGTTGGRFEDYEPGYRYGYEMSHDPRYRNRSFTEVEPELRRDWETRYRDKPWNRFGDSIRDAWEGVTDRDKDYDRTRATQDTDTMRLREERLRADKEREKAGEVNIHKEVVSEQQSMDVPVTREEVSIDRRRVDRPADRPIGEDEDINVPVYEERVNVDKDTVVREEIDVNKRPVQETQHVSDTVRREEARIDREGDVNVRGTGTGRWEDDMPSFRSRWQQRYGNQGGRFEDYEPAYRYGYDMSMDPRYRGRSFSEVEPELRRDWESLHRDTPWEKVSGAIRDTWDEVRGRRDRAA